MLSTKPQSQLKDFQHSPQFPHFPTAPNFIVTHRKISPKGEPKGPGTQKQLGETMEG